MHEHFWLLLFGIVIALQVPLGLVVGSLCAGGKEKDQAITSNPEGRVPTRLIAT